MSRVHPTCASILKAAVVTALALSPFASLAVADDDVKIVKDVAYLGADRAEKMDLYLPANFEGRGKLPAVLIIHGGGWYAGDKEAEREINIGTTLAKSGYVCASINYVLAVNQDDQFVKTLATVWPKNLHDCKTAVRFLRKTSARLHIDPDHIGVIGGSAGGHLTAMVGLTGPDDGLDPTGLYDGYSCQVQAVVPMYGGYDLVALAKDRKMYDGLSDDLKSLCVKASPATYASDDDLPVLLLHGTADDQVPVSQSELLFKAMQKTTVPSELVIVEGAPHSFHLEPKERDLRELVIGFFETHLKK
ncbi:MAG: alpha/beta hydrolase [Planctomycetaceae bacterium]